MTLPYVQSWNISKEFPEATAYLNPETGEYECINRECWINRAILAECGGLSNRGCYIRPIDELPQEERELFTHYTPILRCTGCGKIYFGYQTPTPEGLPVIRKTAEERIAELEERVMRLEEALTRLLNSRERPAIKPEAPHREQSPKEEEEYIILPSIMTV